jgi:Protein of unknown function (DUF3168)
MSAIPLTIAALRSIPAVVTAAGPRIYPVQAPQGAALPHIVVTVGSESEDMTLTGATDRPEARAMIVIRAATAKETGDIGAAIISGLKARFGGATEFYRDPIDSTDYLDGLKVYRRVLGFTVVYSNN